MQPFLQDSNSTTALQCSTGSPKYLEVYPNDHPTDNHIGGYVEPRLLHITDECTLNVDQNGTLTLGNRKNLELLNDVVTNDNHRCEYEIPKSPKHIFDECNLKTDRNGTLTFGKRKSANSEDAPSESLMENRDETNSSSQKRSSVTSLNLSDRKRESLTNIREKSKTLDSLRVSTPIVQSISKDTSPLSLNERHKFEIINNGSDTSLEGRSCSSFGSTMSSAPSTRPSSSLINSQQSLPVNKNNNGLSANREILVANDTIVIAKIPKFQIPHGTLQNGKANIPLIINTQRALTNLLGQSQEIEDGNGIVTYTNLNSDVTRVN